MLVGTRWEFQRLHTALPVDESEIRLNRSRDRTWQVHQRSGAGEIELPGRADALFAVCDLAYFTRLVFGD